MNILTQWLRSYLPELPADDRALAEALTMRGIAVEGEFALSEDTGSRWEMDITTNRVDAMNHYGIARELAAIYGVPLAPIADTAPLEGSNAAPFRVEIAVPDLCGRFTARVLRGVKVGPSTGVIAEYFEALGQKRISAPVDATNYGWLAMGQPTHAFDLDKITGGIQVRLARAGEKLQLLDGSEHTLTTDDLVIADDRKALSLAGVMGGWDSRVTDATTNILVEAAWFDPATVRASARRHGLHTDASHRFERGADFAAAPLANNLVTRLILAQCGGSVEGPLVDVSIPALAAKTANRAPITLRVAEVRRHLGATIDPDGLTAATIERFLVALGCTLTATSAEAYSVQLPSWRLDLAREIDLIEEVARVYGYNAFANTLPPFTGQVIELPHARQEHAVRSTLRALGYSEAVSSTFVSESEATTFGDAHAGAVAMGNPLSAEAGMLRPSLAAAMATMLAHNLHRDVDEVRLFELGTIFTGSTAAVHEQTELALGLTGAAHATTLHTAADALFFAAKGAIETVLAKFEGAVTFDSAGLPAWLETGRAARALLDGKPIAHFGELSAAEAAARKLRQTVVIAQIDAATLLRTPLRAARVAELSRFQRVSRDFSFLLPDSVTWAAVSGALATLALTELRSVEPVEIFRDPKGKAVAAGAYSLLLRVAFQSADRTLTDDELTAWCAQITSALTQLGGTQRA